MRSRTRERAVGVTGSALCENRDSAATKSPARGRALCCVECDAQFALRRVRPKPSRPRPSSASVPGSGVSATSVSISNCAKSVLVHPCSRYMSKTGHRSRGVGRFAAPRGTVEMETVHAELKDAERSQIERVKLTRLQVGRGSYVIETEPWSVNDSPGGREQVAARWYSSCESPPIRPKCRRVASMRIRQVSRKSAHRLESRSWVCLRRATCTSTRAGGRQDPLVTVPVPPER